MMRIGLRRVIGIAVTALIALLLVAVGASTLRQQRVEREVDAVRPAASYVGVGGHRVHYRLTGEGNVTFVLEAGGGDYGGSWGPIVDSLATIGRVFVYDRAGLGWSEPSPAPRTGEEITAELHETLAAVALAPPFVLIGHSLGGALQTLYAIRYPDQTAALLLIDPSHKDQWDRMPRPPALQLFLVTQLTRTARVGLPNLLAESADPVKNRASHIATFGAELRTASRSKEWWGDHPLDLGDTPIYVLTAGDSRSYPAASDSVRREMWSTWRALHEELAGASASPIRRHIIVPGATHYIHRDDPHAVTDAARELVRRLHATP